MQQIQNLILLILILFNEYCITEAQNEYYGVIESLSQDNFHRVETIKKLIVKPKLRIISTSSEAEAVIRERRVVQTTKKRLEFLHIAKTGGTSIEDSGIHYGMNWGRCHFVECIHFKPDIPIGVPSIWHKPLYFLPINYYGDDAALFVVVRNPYERTISHYYYSNRHHLDMDELNHSKTLNDWIDSNMKGQSYINNFFPAYNYVFDLKTQDEAVDYVLRFETLQEDFDYLMNVFSLDVELFVHDNEHDTRASLGVEDLSEEAIQVINDYFYDDFIAFKYHMK